MELRFILEILWRRRRLVTGIFASIFFTIVIGTLMITPSYDATAKILLRKSAATGALLKSIGLSESMSSGSALSDTDRSDYLALAALSPIADKTISVLNLKRMRTRGKLLNAIPGLVTVLRFFGVDDIDTKKDVTSEEFLSPPFTKRIFPQPYVSIDQYEETDIIKIKGVSSVREEAVQIANTMAKYFIDEELNRVRGDYSGARTFIDKNIIKAKEDYSAALKEVKDFKEKEKFTDLDTETTSIIQKTADYKKSMEDNKLSVFKTNASIRSKEAQLKSMPGYQKSSEELKENDVISSLKLTLRDLYLNLAETKTKYTKEHSAVIDIENKIALTKDIMQKEIVKVFGKETVSVNPVYQDLVQKVANDYAELAGYESQVKALPTVLVKYETEMMKLPKRVAEYSKLQLAVTVTQDIYSSLLKYQYQLGMAESAALSNIYLVEPATEMQVNRPKHKKPSLLLNSLIAIILGLMFSIGSAFLVEYLDDTIKTQNDIRKLCDLTFLGTILRLNKKDPRLINIKEPRFILNEFIRTIRNSIKYASLDRALRSIIVTSTMEKEGKSFFVANLAISAANEGKKILVVDVDLRRPMINNYFNLPRGVGLTNYLLGDVELKDIQLKTDIDGLHVITTGPIPPDPGKLVESHKLRDLIKDMEQVYDLVIVDTPPVMAASDCIVLGGYVDGGIIVVQSGRLRNSHFHDVIDSFKRANINILGVVLNQVNKRASTYYYYTDYK